MKRAVEETNAPQKAHQGAARLPHIANSTSSLDTVWTAARDVWYSGLESGTTR